MTTKTGRNIIRTGALTALLGIGLGATLGSAAFADSVPPPSERCSPDMYSTYGVNCDGWVVEVVNNTGYTFNLDESKSKQVWTDSPTITPELGSGANFVKVASGKMAWGGGPANMTMTYKTDTGQSFSFTANSWIPILSTSTVAGISDQSSAGVSVTYNTRAFETDRSNRINPKEPIRITINR